jgi:hypothetical protein
MRDDPFAKLGALDQKLFTKPTPLPATKDVADLVPSVDSQADQQPGIPSPIRTLPTKEENEVGKEGSREVGKEGMRETSAPESISSPSTFNLNAKPYRKDSYLFTDEEFEAMEDLKIELRRKYDVKAIKNDIARCAIGFLITDFQRNRDKSYIVRHLRTKK